MLISFYFFKRQEHLIDTALVQPQAQLGVHHRAVPYAQGPTVSGLATVQVDS
jgi:hypothetical protein